MTAFSERFIDSKDGLKLYLRDYPAQGGERGLPVVCIHGLTRNSKDFEVVAPRIAALGRRVLVLDVRGRGKSDRDPQWERYQAPVYVGDVLHILDTLNIPRAVFVGTSMGGLITMLTAVMAPGRVAAAVMNDIGPVVDPRGIARITSYVGKRGPANTMADMVASVKDAQGLAYPDANDAFWKMMIERVTRTKSDGQIEYDYDPSISKPMTPAPGAAPAPTPDLRPIFAAMATVPLLVIRGEISDILSAEGLAEMRALKPDLTAVEIPRIGHAPTLEEPACEKAIAGFLARVP